MTLTPDTGCSNDDDACGAYAAEMVASKEGNIGEGPVEIPDEDDRV